MSIRVDKLMNYISSEPFIHVFFIQLHLLSFEVRKYVHPVHKIHWNIFYDFRVGFYAVFLCDIVQRNYKVFAFQKFICHVKMDRYSCPGTKSSVF